MSFITTPFIMLFKFRNILEALIVSVEAFYSYSSVYTLVRKKLFSHLLFVTVIRYSSLIFTSAFNGRSIDTSVLLHRRKKLSVSYKINIQVKLLKRF